MRTYSLELAHQRAHVGLGHACSCHDRVTEQSSCRRPPDGGRAPRPGELWRNPDAAVTLRRIADSGAEEFYRGRIAADLITHAARTGGLLRAEDLADHTSTWVDPVRAGYRGLRATTPRSRRPGAATER